MAINQLSRQISDAAVTKFLSSDKVQEINNIVYSDKRMSYTIPGRDVRFAVPWVTAGMIRDETELQVTIMLFIPSNVENPTFSTYSEVVISADAMLQLNLYVRVPEIPQGRTTHLNMFSTNINFVNSASSGSDSVPIGTAALVESIQAVQVTLIGGNPDST